MTIKMRNKVTPSVILTLAHTISTQIEILKSVEDYEEKEQNVTGVSTQTLSAIASGRVSSSKELHSQDVFKKFHRHLDHLTPSHLPGKPSSFQVYLNSLFLDPSNVVVERASIHSLSARASNYVDTRTRAFLAATFPPIKIGSLAGTDAETYLRLTYSLNSSMSVKEISHVQSAFLI